MGLVKIRGQKYFSWTKNLANLQKSWMTFGEFTDVWSKKVGKWPKIFKKWAAENRWGSKDFRICGQKPKNF